MRKWKMNKMERERGREGKKQKTHHDQVPGLVAPLLTRHDMGCSNLYNGASLHHLYMSNVDEA